MYFTKVPYLIKKKKITLPNKKVFCVASAIMVYDALKNSIIMFNTFHYDSFKHSSNHNIQQILDASLTGAQQLCCFRKWTYRNMQIFFHLVKMQIKMHKI